MAEFKVIGVIGAGQMGSGIAQLAAVAGADVQLLDKDAEALLNAKRSISDSVQRFVSKGQLSKEAGIDAQARIKYTSNLEDLQFADIVIEAIVESEEVKKKLFTELDKIVKGSAILASNTSSISITRLASATKRPHQVIGMHFMNPPPIMKLVEIIRGAETSNETFQTTKTLAERFGKTVVCSQDYSGFIVNRILMPMINEAFYTLYTGVATKEDIDAGMKLGTNQPMGPLELADFIGLDNEVKEFWGFGLEMKFLFQCPCCSCFCFMKPQKGKPKEVKESKPKEKEVKEAKPKEEEKKKESKDEKKTE